MKIVQRGNRQLRVADGRLEEMLKAGYTQVDEKTGQLMERPAKEDGVKALKKENDALKKANKALEEANKALEEQAAALIAQLQAKET